MKEKRIRTYKNIPLPDFRLRIARVRKRWAQIDLANRSGVSQARISLIENGRVRPSNHEIKKIADALGMNELELFDEK